MIVYRSGFSTIRNITVQTLLRLSKNGTGQLCTAEEMQSSGVGSRKRTDADGGIEMQQMMITGETELECRDEWKKESEVEEG